MAYKSPSTDCITEGLEICLKCNNFRFGSQNLLQLNGTATVAPNSCSYADLAAFDIDKSVMRYFGRYRDNCLALWTGPLQKLELGIQKGVALRLRIICSTHEEFNNKSKGYRNIRLI